MISSMTMCTCTESTIWVASPSSHINCLAWKTSTKKHVKDFFGRHITFEAMTRIVLIETRASAIVKLGKYYILPPLNLFFKISILYSLVYSHNLPPSCASSWATNDFWSVQVILFTFFCIWQYLWKKQKNEMTSAGINGLMKHTALKKENNRILTAKAFPMDLNASPAPGALFLSGWNCRASLR